MFMFTETAKGMSSVEWIMNNVDKNNLERENGSIDPQPDWP